MTSISGSDPSRADGVGWIKSVNYGAGLLSPAKNYL
jgi:hypothetical protein